MFAKTLTGFALCVGLLLPSAAGQSDSESVPAVYPANIWAKGVAPLETEAELDALIEDAMSRAFTDEMGESRQIVVIHKGRLVAERYADGFTPDTKLVSWSMAKSITQALVGRAVMEGLIDDIDAPMPSPWEAGDLRSEITWRQWMTMTDGLDYSEVGETDLNKNDVVQMMFGPGRYDMVGYVEGLEQVHAAGTHWNYSTAAFHMISRALQADWVNPNVGQVLSGEHFDAFEADILTNINTWEEKKSDRGRETSEMVKRFFAEAKKVPADRRALWSKKKSSTTTMKLWLFTPLGMDAQPEFDAAGTFLGGSLVYASARDFARFGYLYLRDGVWEGERLLPEGWVEFATTAHKGTDIWVVPSKDLVIVRLGLMSNAPENWAALYEWNQKVARAFPDVE